MTRYLISDLHLGHANVIDYCARPFSTVEEMNQTLIANWNETVNDADIVFFLGDLDRFADGDQLRSCLDRLNGRIVFIEGNHDKPSRYVTGLNTHQYYMMARGERRFCLVHRPENALRYWDSWVIHGHHHNTHLDEYPFVNPEEERVNVSAELVGYTPVAEHDVIAYIDRGERIESL